jgi:hypothetical protein
MAIVTIRCDVAGCSRRCESDASTEDQARTVARLAFDWAFVEGCDYCPDCAQLPDVVAALAAAGGGA